MNESILLEALEKIAHPLKYLHEVAKRDGAKLDGRAAIELSTNANWLQSIATEAIKKCEDSSGKETGMTKEYFIQLFRDNFNCYADTGNSGTSVPAMSEDQILKTFFHKFLSVSPYKEDEKGLDGIADIPNIEGILEYDNAIDLLRDIDKSLYLGEDLNDKEILDWYVEVTKTIKDSIKLFLTSAYKEEVDKGTQIGIYEYAGHKCVAGCKNFSHNETKHHPDCPFYKGSLSEHYDKIDNFLESKEDVDNEDMTREEWNDIANGRD